MVIIVLITTIVSIFANLWAGLIVFLILVSYQCFTRYRLKKRQNFIDQYTFPKKISIEITKKYPHLNNVQVINVIEQLRIYFHVCNDANGQFVSMPSQVVDVAWHEFILFTKAYNDFCKQAFGRFLHHTPSEGMTTPTNAHSGIKTAWKLTCKREHINPRSAQSIPLLFAIDALFDIDDGFHYSLDCSITGTHKYCATHIGCGGAMTGGSVLDVDFDGSGDGGGCGGGCGGCGG